MIDGVSSICPVNIFFSFNKLSYLSQKSSLVVPQVYLNSHSH